MGNEGAEVRREGDKTGRQFAALHANGSAPPFLRSFAGQARGKPSPRARRIERDGGGRDGGTDCDDAHGERLVDAIAAAVRTAVRAPAAAEAAPFAAGCGLTNGGISPTYCGRRPDVGTVATAVSRPSAGEIAMTVMLLAAWLAHSSHAPSFVSEKWRGTRMSGDVVHSTGDRAPLDETAKTPMLLLPSGVSARLDAYSTVPLAFSTSSAAPYPSGLTPAGRELMYVGLLSVGPLESYAHVAMDESSSFST